MTTQAQAGAMIWCQEQQWRPVARPVTDDVDGMMMGGPSYWWDPHGHLHVVDNDGSVWAVDVALLRVGVPVREAPSSMPSPGRG